MHPSCSLTDQGNTYGIDGACIYAGLLFLFFKDVDACRHAWARSLLLYHYHLQDHDHDVVFALIIKKLLRNNKLFNNLI